MNVLDQFKLDGKIALVTGASRGLGQAMALGLAEAGADIVGMSRQTEGGEVQAQVQALGRRYTHIQCDLMETSVEQINRLVDDIVAEMGHLDIVVNNAGINRRAEILEFTEAHWDQVLQVNLKAAFFLSQAAARVMKAQGGGKIIQIASVLTFEGGLYIPAYTAAKHGISGIAKSMANELAAHNIQINAIAPGYFSTDLTAPLEADPDRSRALMARIPTGRFGRPEELKGLVVYLASAASSYVNGSTFAIDGGWLAR